MAKSAREAYKRAVEDLALVAEALKREAKGDEEIARTLVAMRNGLKKNFRAFDPPAAVALMERRNQAKYGDPLGPNADWFYKRCGSWALVVDAACRPARLSDSL